MSITTQKLRMIWSSKTFLNRVSRFSMAKVYTRLKLVKYCQKINNLKKILSEINFMIVLQFQAFGVMMKMAELIAINSLRLKGHYFTLLIMKLKKVTKLFCTKAKMEKTFSFLSQQDRKTTLKSNCLLQIQRRQAQNLIFMMKIYPKYQQRNQSLFLTMQTNLFLTNSWVIGKLIQKEMNFHQLRYKKQYLHTNHYLNFMTIKYYVQPKNFKEINI